MITEIDFKVKGEERKKLAYAIGELLGMPVKYIRACLKNKNCTKRMFYFPFS